MGSICCPDEDNQRPRQSIRPVALQRNQPDMAKRSSSAVRAESQRLMLQDYPQLVRYLREHGHQEQQLTKFVSFYIHERISSDQLSEMFWSTLVDENGIEFDCVARKISKSRLISVRLKSSLAAEYLVSKYLECPFVAFCLTSYSSEDSLYQFYDLRAFQPLRYFAKNVGRPQHISYFWQNPDQNIRFVIAGVILALQKLHQLSIVCRGISIDTILIMDNGYPIFSNLSRLHPEGCVEAGFGLTQFSSPEQSSKSPITRAADMWALGALLYYMATGNAPSHSSFSEGQFKAEGLSSEFVSLVNGLLRIRPEDRLGARNIQDIKNHAFFRGFEWSNYQEMTLESPLSQYRAQLPQDLNSRDYAQKSTLQNLDNNNYGAMDIGTMLFMDIATVWLVSEWLGAQSGGAEGREEAEQVRRLEDYNIDQNQMATEIDLGNNDFDFGGDYD